MPEVDPQQAQLRQIVGQQAAEHARLTGDAKLARRQLADLTAKRSAAAAGGRATELARLDRQITATQAQGNALRDQLGKLEQDWRGGLGRIVIDPCDASATTPLLLLPVRIETRFATGDRNAPLLRVRIYPDAIHLDRHRRALTDAEIKAGAAYWNVARGGEEGGVAWEALVAAVGRRRATWVAKETSAPQGAGASPADIGPVARLLPDRFVVEVRQNGRVKRVTGNPIGPDPRMGLFDDDEDEADMTLVNGIPAAKGAEWIVDYAKAEEIGLAVTVPLLAMGPIERVTAFGVRRSVPEDAAAAAFSRLLEAHRYSDGLALLRVGTPTNNLPDERSGYVPAPAGAPQDDTAPTGAGAGLARALGLAPGALDGVDGADLPGNDAAAAINTIFWQPSWGDFLDMIDTEVKGDRIELDTATLERVRAFHRDNVRGRGPLPPMRVGKQPYGLLPVGAVDGLWSATGTQAGILDVVRKARALWRAALPAVPRLGEGAPDKTMLEMLGTSPIAIGLRARAAVSKNYLNAAADVTAEEQMEAIVSQLVWGQVANASLSFPVNGLSQKALPIPLPFADPTDAAALAGLANGGTIAKPKSVLQAFAALAMDHARRRRGKSPLAALDTVTGLWQGGAVGRRPPAAAMAQAIAQAGQQGPAAVQTLMEQTVGRAPVSIARYQPERSGRKSFVELITASVNEEARRELAGHAITEIVVANTWPTELVKALQRIAQPDLSTDDRRILVAEALDIASHRLDAWVTGLVEARRRTLRDKTPLGLQVGAFGWVENVRPATPLAEGYGFIHAPSAAHAATAGILRSAYLAHAKEGNQGAFAIDLSSARARLAMDLLDARRAGQTMSEALGYRVERMMVDGQPTLARFIRSIRTMYPVRQGKLSDAGDVLEPTGREHIAGTTVVDGVALVEDVKKRGTAAIATQLGVKPADNPYLDPASWTGFTAAEGQAFAAIGTAAVEALDAVADLLLAESVHQLALGNTARAAATMDVATGDSLPPEPAVLGAPAPMAMLSHRVMVMLPPVASGGWSTTGFRAQAAPEIEAWVAARLGKPGDILVTLPPTGQPVSLAAAGLSALDLVFEAGDRAGLVRRILARVGLPPDTAILVFANPDLAPGRTGLGEALDMAETLRANLAASRPVTGADLDIPYAETVRQASAKMLAAARQRLVVLGGALKVQIGEMGKPQLPAAADAILNTLAGFGILVPGGADPVALLQPARAEAQRRFDELLPLLGQPGEATTVDRLAKAARALFGEGFPFALPLDAVPASDGWTGAIAASGTLAKPAELRRWLSDMGSVRPPLARYADGLLAAEARGAAPRLVAAQMLKPGTEAAVKGFAGTNNPAAVAAACVLEVPVQFDPAAPVVGIVIDSFAEPIADTGDRDTAIAFNAPSPGARPPQTMLLAVSPDDKRWTTDRLAMTLDETVELAKLRGVTLERGGSWTRLLPAIYARSASLQGEPVIDWTQLATAVWGGPMLYTKDL